MKPLYLIRKVWLALIVLVSWLGHAASLRATAIYDDSVMVTVDFNVPWVSVQRITNPSPFPFVGPGVTRRETSTTGNATAHAVFQENANLLNYTYTQGVRVTGSAGDAALLDSGTSFATADLYNLFTFDFGPTPTDFTITLLAGDFRDSNSTDAPVLNGHITSNGTGEAITGGGGGYQVLLLKPNGDFSGIGLNLPGQSVTVNDLKGIHTFRIGTLVDGGATAVYPYTVTTPEAGSSFVLLSVSLLSCGIFRRFRYTC
jgi:hypothetical protein